MGIQNQIPDTEVTASNDRSLYRTAGIAALITVAVMVVEMLITLLPAGAHGGVEVMTVVDWFELFQNNGFMGLRNLGLMNMLAIVFTIPIYVALCLIHRRSHGAFAALAAILFFVGVAIYLSNNTAFSMLSLSRSYETAASEAEKTMILAAGKALLARGESHTAGTFLGFLFLDAAGIAISLVMLRARVFGVVAALAGTLGYLFLLLFDIFSSFVPALFEAAMLFVLIGGPLSLLWDVLIAVEFLRVGFRGQVAT